MAAVVGTDNRINLKKITIGRDFGNALEILDGVTPTDRVVINPPDALEQGEEVNIAAQNDAPASGKANATPTKQ
jgi:hypothetical protein